VISLMIIFVAMIVVFAGSYAWDDWRNRREVRDKQGKPVCGCDHHRAMHDPKTNECHGRNYEGGGIYSRCTCRQYIGPEPLPSYYVSEIEPGGQP